MLVIKSLLLGSIWCYVFKRPSPPLWMIDNTTDGGEFLILYIANIFKIVEDYKSLWVVCLRLTSKGEGIVNMSSDVPSDLCVHFLSGLR